MTNKMKKIFILTPLIILLCLFGVYFLFPGVMFGLLTTAERSAAGLKQHSIYVKGLRIEYLEGGKGDALVLLHGFGAKILEAIMPKAKAEVMDAVGHLPMIEKPEETAALYLSFLEQREPGLR